MPLKISPDRLKQIEKAVAEAENESGAEIVPVFSKQSATYEIALWRGGVLFAIAAAVIMVMIYLMEDWFLMMPPYFWTLIPMAAGAVGALAASLIPSLRRTLIGCDLMAQKVEDKAKVHFYNQNLSMTAQRSGVLLFISFFEKKAVILADIGLAELVPNEEWQAVVSRLADGIKRGEIVDSIVEAIRDCGKIIANTGLQKAEDGGNELSDTVIIES